MDVIEAISQRHSVRSYKDMAIDKEIIEELETFIAQGNQESGLHIQLFTQQRDVFTGVLAHYGKFRNVQNYLAIVGKKEAGVEELCGYYGERIVLKATQLGLQSCWVALTYKKRKVRCVINPDEKLYCVIALGYGTSIGTSHKMKAIEELCEVAGAMPLWFENGMKAAQLAPTAVNQQKFLLRLQGDEVEAIALKGKYSKLDLGIIKYHFEQGAGKKGWKWK